MLEAYQVDDENWESSNMLFCLLSTSIEVRNSLENKRKTTVSKKKKTAKASAVSDYS